MHAHLQRQIQLFDQRRQPASCDRTRVGGHRKNPHKMRVELQVIPAHFGSRGRDEIGQCPRAERKQALVR
jgi:hypothetical protein